MGRGFESFRAYQFSGQKSEVSGKCSVVRGQKPASCDSGPSFWGKWRDERCDTAESPVVFIRWVLALVLGVLSLWIIALNLSTIIPKKTGKQPSWVPLVGGLSGVGAFAFFP